MQAFSQQFNQKYSKNQKTQKGGEMLLLSKKIKIQNKKWKKK